MNKPEQTRKLMDTVKDKLKFQVDIDLENRILKEEVTLLPDDMKQGYKLNMKGELLFNKLKTVPWDKAKDFFQEWAMEVAPGMGDSPDEELHNDITKMGSWNEWLEYYKGALWVKNPTTLTRHLEETYEILEMQDVV